MRSPLLKEAMRKIFGQGKSKAAEGRRKQTGTVYNGKPGQEFTTESGATYQVQKNGSFRRIN